MTQDTEAVPLEPPVAGDEVATLVGSLERQRRTFAWKTEGLDAAGLGVRIASSSVTLGGLLRHLALVEDQYLSVRLLGNEPAPEWRAGDRDAEPGSEWRSAAGDTPEQLYALWAGAVARSRANLRSVLAEGDAGRLAAFTTRDGRSPSVRRILVDLIEEYARHVGHADLIRESIDGRVGEDPPEDFQPWTI
ncbi:DinB family protein [Streptomyces lomondensis]|uniref:Mini-circle protein n=1 Tax=Streptomyces lomondensis TaxID=68229 RepID=A0ABQ2X0U6_9ACTN|nr:DinB family protein [Streptomyces lomondensis]MCF0075907.1 DinB family protein [Streptomyces lomondensis]GGW90137.1 mini-circle protein [Streptomyces lomondensis]